MLDKLREMTGGDEDRMKVYVTTFMGEFPSYIEKLEAAIAENDRDGIRYVAHICKPLLSMMGFDELNIQADEIEKKIRSGEGNNAVDEAKDLLAELNRAVEEIRAF